MKTKNPVLVIMMLILLTFFLLPASGEAETDSTAVDRFVNDLLNYVYRSEIMYGDHQWTLDAFERFDRERSWESLQMARASLALARNEISKLKLPPMEMTFEDQDELMEMGIDSGFMENVPASFNTNKTFLLNSCLDLHYKIMDQVFLRREWRISMEYVDLCQRIIDSDIQYLANTVDWVLMSINDEDITMKVDGLLAEYCPLTQAHRMENLDSPEKIESITNELLDNLSLLVIELNKTLGESENNINYLEDILISGDLSLLEADLMDISGMPPVLFYPEWFDDEDIYYYWKENDEIQPAPLPRTELDRIPDGCLINIDGVSQEDFFLYLLEIDDAGVPYPDISDNDEEIMTIFEFGGSSFAFRWENESVSILMSKNPICFVPAWYLPAVIHPDAITE